MADALKKLIEATRSLDQSSGEREQQRRSFAYGNTKFENERITGKWWIGRPNYWLRPQETERVKLLFK